jgi:hypothetical protein
MPKKTQVQISPCLQAKSTQEVNIFWPQLGNEIIFESEIISGSEHILFGNEIIFESEIIFGSEHILFGNEIIF